MDRRQRSKHRIAGGDTGGAGVNHSVGPLGASNKTNVSYNVHDQTMDGYQSSHNLHSLDYNRTLYTGQGTNAHILDDAHALSNEQRTWSTTATRGSSPEGDAECLIFQDSESTPVVNQAGTGSAFAVQRWLEQSVQEDPWWHIDVDQSKDTAGEKEDDEGDLGLELDVLMRESQTRGS